MIHILKSKKNGKYYFNVTANNRKVVAQSQGYKTKRGCKKGIAALLKACRQSVVTIDHTVKQ